MKRLRMMRNDETNKILETIESLLPRMCVCRRLIADSIFL